MDDQDSRGGPPARADATTKAGADKNGVSDIQWRLCFGVGLALTLLYTVAPYGVFTSTVYVGASFLAAIALGVAAYRRRELFEPLAWTLVAAALALSATGHAIWYWLDLHGLEPFPSSADIFYLLVYPLFMAALWKLGRENSREHALGDALIVGISAAVLGWALLIAPYWHDPDLTLLQLIVSAAYPVGDLLVLPLILHLVFLHRTQIRAHLFLLLGMCAYLAADVLYAQGNSAGWYIPGGFTDALWLIAYSLFAAAAWHPSAADTPEGRTSNAEVSVRRVLILGASSVLVPGIILFTLDTHTEIVRVAAIASIILFLLIMHRMAGLIRALHDQAEALEHLSRTDPLTGTTNRRHLDHELTREIARGERTGTPLTLAFLDLDHFKRFNDTHGHSEGDDLLRELVLAWRAELRPTDILARYGGEEFIVVFPDTNLGECERVVDRLRDVIPYNQTCSGGIAEFRHGETIHQLLARADQALYAAKEHGRNRTVIASQAGLIPAIQD